MKSIGLPQKLSQMKRFNLAPETNAITAEVKDPAPKQCMKMKATKPSKSNKKWTAKRLYMQQPRKVG